MRKPTNEKQPDNPGAWKGKERNKGVHAETHTGVLLCGTKTSIRSRHGDGGRLTEGDVGCEDRRRQQLGRGASPANGAAVTKPCRAVYPSHTHTAVHTATSG